MEIIKVGNDTFKISLSADETKKYQLSSDSQQKDASMTKSLKKLLDENGIGFGGDRASAEIYISKDGGCEIFVSRAQGIQLPKKQSQPTSKTIYRFDKLQELILACSRLLLLSLDATSCMYHDKATGAYYMVLTGIYSKDLKYAFLCEYASRTKSNMLPYIKEHCECICENNAIEILSKLL